MGRQEEDVGRGVFRRERLAAHHPEELDRVGEAAVGNLLAHPALLVRGLRQPAEPEVGAHPLCAQPRRRLDQLPDALLLAQTPDEKNAHRPVRVAGTGREPADVDHVRHRHQRVSGKERGELPGQPGAQHHRDLGPGHAPGGQPPPAVGRGSEQGGAAGAAVQVAKYGAAERPRDQDQDDVAQETRVGGGLQIDRVGTVPDHRGEHLRRGEKQIGEAVPVGPVGKRVFAPFCGRYRNQAESGRHRGGHEQAHVVGQSTHRGGMRAHHEHRRPRRTCVQSATSRELRKNPSDPAE